METRKMGEYLKEVNRIPDLILSSPAARTEETAIILAETLGINPLKIRYDSDLYLESGDGISSYLKAIKKTENSVDSLLISGHNPDLTDLVAFLTGLDIPYLKKSSLVVLQPKINQWQELKGGICRLHLYMSPAYLKDN